MKILMLLSSVTGSTDNQDARNPCAPVSEAQALRAALAGPDHEVEVWDQAAVAGDASPVTRLVRRAWGPDVALAVKAFRRRRGYDVVFSNSEQVALPLALLFRVVPRRPAHVSVAHRLNRSGLRWLFPLLGLRHSFDTLFVYAQTQRDFAEDQLGLLGETLALISPQVDDHFFRPCPATAVSEDQVCAAGRRGCDDPILSEAAAALPDVTLKTAHTLGQHDDEALRDLYAHSSFVVVPLCETDGAGGATTILQAMAMGKAVIATRADGATDMIIEGVNGLTVLPGDVAGWQNAMTRLRADPALRARLGHNARRWVEEHAAQDRWARRIAESVCLAASSPLGLSAPAAEICAPAHSQFPLNRLSP